MGNEAGTWIMHGVTENDPECIHTVEQAIEYINGIGFLPLFENGIPGFSLEERTVPSHWWSGNPAIDPWEWRELIARSGEVAYGKFFNNKAGFISKAWFPYFANFRRDGYDFDSLWDDEMASIRQKHVMDFFMGENEGAEYFSFELKKKVLEKGFDGTVTSLQMQTYLLIKDFRQRRNKYGDPYGWPIAIYCTPEHLWGYDYATSSYREKPEKSAERIARQVMDKFPGATSKQMSRVLGIKI